MTQPVDRSRTDPWSGVHDAQASAVAPEAPPPTPNRAAARRDPPPVADLPDHDAQLVTRAARAHASPKPTTAEAVTPEEVRLARDTQVKARLQGVFERWRPHYSISAGATPWWPVQAMFVRASPQAPTPDEKHKTQILYEIGSRLGITRADVDKLQVGRGTPEHMRLLTQALAYSNWLGQSDDLSYLRVRETMFKFHIGVDGPGYVQQASAAARGVPLERAGFRPVLQEDLSMLERQGYRRVRIEDARPGDILELQPTKGQALGQRAIVYDVRTATQDDVDLINDIDAKAPLAEVGQVKLYSLDASWDNFGSRYTGGVERREIFHDEAHDLWGERIAELKFVSSTVSIAGLYRPKDTP